VKIWNQDEGVLDTQVTATHEEHSGQPAGTENINNLFIFSKDWSKHLMKERIQLEII